MLPNHLKQINFKTLKNINKMTNRSSFTKYICNITIKKTSRLQHIQSALVSLIKHNQSNNKTKYFLVIIKQSCKPVVEPVEPQCETHILFPSVDASTPLTLLSCSVNSSGVFGGSWRE